MKIDLIKKSIFDKIKEKVVKTSSLDNKMPDRTEVRQFSCIKSLVNFDDMASINSLAYLLDETNSLISINLRAFRPSYKYIGGYFPQDLLLMHKLALLFGRCISNSGPELGNFLPEYIPLQVKKTCLEQMQSLG